MKNKLKTILCIVAQLCFMRNLLQAKNILSLFVRPYPTIIDQAKAEHKLKKLIQPGKIAYYSMKSSFNHNAISNIFASYDGNITSSDYNGQIVFPTRQTDDPSINLLITQQLTPITMVGNTIHHWEPQEGIPVAYYTIERKQDEETNKFFWKVNKSSISPDDIIPIFTFWLVAQPSKIYVPEGITPTRKSQNFILPPIYAKKGIMKISNALYALNLKHFFSSVKKNIKLDKNQRLVIVH